MDNPEIQSSRSTSTMEDPDFHESFSSDYSEDEVDWIAKVRREGRKTEAEDFRAEYFYGRCMDKKTCIWPSGRASWSDLAALADPKDPEDPEDLECPEYLEYLEAPEDPEDSEDPEDLEDPVDPLSKLREMFGQSIKKPFGVVSVVPLTDKVHKASCPEYQETKITKYLLEGLNREETSSDDESDIDFDDEDVRIKYLLKLSRRHQRTLPGNPGFDETKTIKFIKEEMKRNAAIKINETVEESSGEYDEERAIDFLEEEMRTEDFTLDKTIQTAISAFELLFKKKFKANEIEVCVMDPDYFVDAEDADVKDIYVNHLETSEIEHLLAVMNKPGSIGSSSGGSCSGGSSSLDGSD